MNKVINDHRVGGMASTSRQMFPEFSGKENIATWWKRCSLVAKVKGLNNAEIARQLLIALREEAQEWVGESIDLLLEKRSEKIIHLLKVRFENRAVRDETLQRFLDRKLVVNKKEFIELLQDVGIILEFGLNNFGAGVTLIIKKVPEYFRVALYEKSYPVFRGTSSAVMLSYYLLEHFLMLRQF